jgi:hypothetical protein
MSSSRPSRGENLLIFIIFITSPYLPVVAVSLFIVGFGSERRCACARQWVLAASKHPLCAAAAAVHHRRGGEQATAFDGVTIIYFQQ